METLYFYTQMLKKTKQGIKGSKLDKTPRNTNKDEKKIKLRIHQVIASKLIKNSKPTFKHNISLSEPANKAFFNSSLTNYFKKQSLEEAETDTNELGHSDNGEVKNNPLLSLLKKPNSTNSFTQPCSNPKLNYIQKEIINVNYIRKNRNQWKSKFPSDYVVQNYNPSNPNSIRVLRFDKKRKRNSYNECRKPESLYKLVQQSHRHPRDFPIRNLIKSNDSYEKKSWNPYIRTNLGGLLQGPVKDRIWERKFK